MECNKIISTHRFDFLIAVRKNADSLASILNNKPEGEIEIPGTMCYRLDNLIKLLHTLSAESDDVRKVYFEDAKMASNALADEMQQTISAINKLVPGVDTNTPQMLLNKITLTKETNHPIMLQACCSQLPLYQHSLLYQMHLSQDVHSMQDCL